MNLQENIQRIKIMMGLLNEEESDCQKKVDSALGSATQKWKDWLNHPVTKQKFMSNHKIDQVKMDEIYSKYNKLLKEIKIVSYDSKFEFPEYNDPKLVETAKNFGDAAAFVIPKYPETIFYNCDGFSSDIFTNLSHEISHLLDYIFPKNPLKNVKKLYGKNKTSNKFNTKNFESFLTKINISDVIEKERIKNRFLKILTAEKSTINYYCDEIENIQGVQKLRDELGKQPGDNITTEEIIPFFTFKTENFDDDIKNLVACWVLKGFPDINSYLSNLNLFAKQKSKQISNQV